MLTFFRRTNILENSGSQTFESLPDALAHWGGEQLHGPAIAGVLARAARDTATEVAPQFVPGRSAIEMFRPTRAGLVEVSTQVVRRGARIVVIDAFVNQEGQTSARAHFFFCRAGEEPVDEIWTPNIDLAVPEADIGFDRQARCYRNEESGWGPQAIRAQSSGRKYAWQAPFVLIEAEETGPLEMLVASSDLTSLVVHWGRRGVGFINTDATMSIGKLPTGDGLGVVALHRVGTTGISAGAALIFDHSGPVALSMVSGLAQTSVNIVATEEGFVAKKL